ncbi:MAG: flavodoxin family protein [Thermodesulfobacteriota bacterium]
MVGKTLLVVYHSQSGNTSRMAMEVAAGARMVEGIRVILKRASETQERDLLECDALILGSPEYFGYMAGALKDLFDRTYEALRGHPRIFRKPYAVFISAGNDGQGALQSIERICVGYQFRKVQPPVLARGPLTEDILARCRELGQTVAAGCEAGIF